MTDQKRDTLLEFYKGELTWLRKTGAAFARQYPKVAGRLQLGADQSPDPHVERLIEAFAFLTARIQYNLESEFPRISAALLNTLYPQFLSPIPSVTVARFEVDPDQGGLTSAHVIPRHTPLYARATAPTGEKQTCRFRTCYPVTLLPVEVAEAGFISTDHYDFLDSGKRDNGWRNLKPGEVATVLRIRIRSRIGDFQDLDSDRLRFYLRGEQVLTNALYELIFAHVHRVAVLPEGSDHPYFLPDDAILPVGFAPDEAVLPYPSNAHPAYRLLHEYFTFPGKFLFFDVTRLKAHGAATYFDILILLDRMPERRVRIGPDTFCLGCTPVINLFHKTTDPIRIDHRQTRYPLFPDKRREKITEIHSVRSVSASPDPEDRSEPVAPFFSFNHQTEARKGKAFWYADRRDTVLKNLPGTRMRIAFTDLDFNPQVPSHTTVYAHTLCTNRRLAEDLPEGAVLRIEREAPVARISTLHRPTPQIDPPLDGETLWRLISHLSLNHLSLGSGPESLTALREILKLYSFSERSSTWQQIAGIERMACRSVVRRMGSEVWKGFCRGIEITLEFDEKLYEGNSAFLLASVLNRFFPLYASVNAFTRLIIKSQQREGIWKKWPPMTGEQFVL
ncbi:type VI secretion system baseplate subunit TssF [Desulfonema ishimotonii]|uniref:Type VI secretion system baseplate subunit TssF n=1 Tax=Desulfonema ishimotonii TaxID=45657 RepID=A0A401FYW8_9BACT|nr:type VI secretion system baseplate subunit TssF [Desulfonema ishimotonii]GBC62140.1 type VI secretion system baseplate subunit TssF [Desulfonema ishimotonii]